jgi:hypothetical protein
MYQSLNVEKRIRMGLFFTSLQILTQIDHLLLKSLKLQFVQLTSTNIPFRTSMNAFLLLSGIKPGKSFYL